MRIQQMAEHHPHKSTVNEDEFLIFLPFSFSKVLQMSESLEPQDPFLQLKQCPVCDCIISALRSDCTFLESQTRSGVRQLSEDL